MLTCLVIALVVYVVVLTVKECNRSQTPQELQTRCPNCHTTGKVFSREISYEKGSGGGVRGVLTSRGSFRMYLRSSNTRTVCATKHTCHNSNKTWIR